MEQQHKSGQLVSELRQFILTQVYVHICESCGILLN